MLRGGGLARVRHRVNEGETASLAWIYTRVGDVHRSSEPRHRRAAVGVSKRLLRHGVAAPTREDLTWRDRIANDRASAAQRRALAAQPLAAATAAAALQRSSSVCCSVNIIRRNRRGRNIIAVSSNNISNINRRQ